jgi:hypothetical protein
MKFTASYLGRRVLVYSVHYVHVIIAHNPPPGGERLKAGSKLEELKVTVFS